MAEAKTKFEKAVKLAPENAAAWNGLGWASFHCGNAAQAEKAFKRTLELAPNAAAALNGLGQLYLSQRKYDEAEKWLLQAAPDSPPVSHDWTRYAGIVEIPSGTKTLTIGLQIYGPGKIWFDDVPAEFVPDSTPKTDALLVQPGDEKRAEAPSKSD